MSKLIEFDVVFDSERHSVSCTAPLRILIDVGAIETVSEESREQLTCRLTLRPAIVKHADDEVLVQAQRLLIVRAGYREIFEILSDSRGVIGILSKPMPSPATDKEAIRDQKKASSHRPRFIKVFSDWFADEPIFLPSVLKPLVQEGFRFRIGDNRVIEEGWRTGDPENNFTFYFVKFDADRISSIIESEASIKRRADEELKRRQWEAIREKARQRVLAENRTIDAILIQEIASRWTSKLKLAPANELAVYARKVPGRLAPTVGNLVASGEEFDFAVGEATRALLDALEKKGATLYKLKKNRS